MSPRKRVTEDITYIHPRSGAEVSYRRSIRNRVVPTPHYYSVARVLALGERACKEHDMLPTAGNVAVHLGVSRATVLAWRQGRRKGVSLTVADAIANRFDIHLSDLEEDV